MKPASIRIWQALVAWGLAVTSASCGVGTGGTGTFAQGSITGFGSVVVNGVRFDETAARIEDDSGATLSAAALGLGMTVQVQAGPTFSNAGVATAVAGVIRINRALVGPASDVDVAARRFSVLGQRVAVGADTVMDERLTGGLAGLSRAGNVEVYGSFDAVSGNYLATRIAPAANNATLKVSGPVGQIDLVARTFKIGTQTYSFSGFGGLTGLGDSGMLGLNLQGSPDAQGRWVVSGQSTPALLPTEAMQLELRGLVQRSISVTRFVLDGLTVDMSTAQVQGGPGVGARVRVSGSVVGGVLMASSVSVETGATAQLFELEGAITTADAARRQFVLRNTRVDHSRADLVFTGGTAAHLLVARKVRVEGRLAADGITLEATGIRFLD